MSSLSNAIKRDRNVTMPFSVPKNYVFCINIGGFLAFFTCHTLPPLSTDLQGVNSNGMRNVAIRFSRLETINWPLISVLLPYVSISHLLVRINVINTITIYISDLVNL